MNRPEVKMRSEQEVRDSLSRVSGDERLTYEPVLVQVNAPLALIQVELEARKNVLRWMLGLDPTCGGSAVDPR